MIKMEEALLVFKKWRDEKSLILCTSSLFSCWSLALRGRVAAISEQDEVRVDSLDGAATVLLELRRADGFEYAEPGHAPEPMRSQVPKEWEDASFLLVALPSRVPGLLLRRDKLGFIELR